MGNTMSSISLCTLDSQIRKTSQPSAASLKFTSRSRWRFRAIFIIQYSLFLYLLSRSHKLGQLFPCQKSPSMKIAIRLERKTISGLPKMSLVLIVYLNPLCQSAFRIASSQDVFFDLIRFINAERWGVVLNSMVINMRAVYAYNNC